MNRNMIMKTDILDIIFEKRNKAYGAYNLRKYYPGRLKLALGFMLFLGLAFSAFTFLPEKKAVITGRIYVIPETKFKEAVKIPEAPVKKPELKKPVSQPVKPLNQIKYNSNIQIVANNIKTDTIKDLLPQNVISSVNVTAPLSGEPAIQIVNAGTGGGETDKGEIKIDRTIPMGIGAVDVEPAFPGGVDALKEFLEKNLQNPYDQENGETVSVKVKFVVGYNGKLQSFVVDEDGGDIYNKEVIRVIKKMPDWKPGKAKGENVSVYYAIPVKFVMSN